MCIRNVLKKFYRDNSASILPTFAILVVPLLLSVGAAIDYADHQRIRNKLTNAADAAVLAAAVEANKSGNFDNKALLLKQMTSTINSMLSVNMAKETQVEYKISNLRYDPKTLDVDLNIIFSHKTHIMQLGGVPELDGKIKAATFLTEKDGNPFSMYLVLDRSGSMRNRGRMIALKNAVTAMTTDFKTKDPNKEFIRMGAIGYNHLAMEAEHLDWGVEHVNRYTQKLEPDGLTNSSTAMSIAAGSLKGNREKDIHKKKSKKISKKYILFMTDGKNNENKNDKKTKKTCTRAKNDEVIIYTVAFQALEDGKKLLKSCANSNQHYFEAKNVAELIKIFKIIGKNTGRNLALTQ